MCTDTIKFPYQISIKVLQTFGVTVDEKYRLWNENKKETKLTSRISIICHSNAQTNTEYRTRIIQGTNLTFDVVDVNYAISWFALFW